MKKLLEEIKKTHEELNTKLQETEEREKELKETGERLAFDYKICDDALEDAEKHFEKIEKNIEKREKNYITKRNYKRINKINGGIITTTLVITTILNLFHIPANFFFATIGSILLSGIYTVADLLIFYDKYALQYKEDFENLESTKRIRNTSDLAYVKKLQKERELMDLQNQIIDNTKKLNETKIQKNSIKNKIADEKINSFDQIMSKETIDGPILTLK